MEHSETLEDFWRLNGLFESSKINFWILKIQFTSSPFLWRKNPCTGLLTVIFSPSLYSLFFRSPHSLYLATTSTWATCQAPRRWWTLRLDARQCRIFRVAARGTAREAARRSATVARTAVVYRRDSATNRHSPTTTTHTPAWNARATSIRCDDRSHERTWSRVARSTVKAVSRICRAIGRSHCSSSRRSAKRCQFSTSRRWNRWTSTWNRNGWRSANRRRTSLSTLTRRRGWRRFRDGCAIWSTSWSNRCLYRFHLASARCCTVAETPIGPWHRSLTVHPVSSAISRSSRADASAPTSTSSIRGISSAASVWRCSRPTTSPWPPITSRTV